MRTIIRVIDSISEHTGKTVLWLCIALVLVLAYETTARYVFNAPTMWAMETGKMIGGTIIVMGWSYTHLHHGHIRVDVLYTHLPPRGRAIIDVTCSLLFLFPLLSILLYTSTTWMLLAWKMGERLVETNFLPPAGPIRTVLVLGFCLFALQCMAQFTRDLYLLIRNKPL